MKDNFKNKLEENIILLILVLLTELISVFLIRPTFFMKDEDIFYSNFSYWFTNISFIVLAFFFYKCIFYFFRKIINKDKFYKKVFKHSCIYFLFMLIFFLLVYPGEWFYDEFWIMNYSKYYILTLWQSYISTILYTNLLSIVANPIIIIIFQILVISIIFGYIQSKFEMIYCKKIINITIYIIFLTPVFLINNLFCLRSTLYTYIVLLFYGIILFDYIEKNKITKKKIIILLVLSFLMINWRPEGIIFLIGNIICLLYVYPELRKKILTTKIIILIILPTLIYSRIGDTKIYTAASTTILPLSIMLNQDLKGKNIEKDIKNINKVFDVDEMKKYPNYIFMESFFDGNLANSSRRKNIDISFYISYMDIIANNFTKFLKVRWKVFSIALTDALYTNNCYRAYHTNYKMADDVTNLIREFVEPTNLHPINLELKLKVESFLMENNIIKGIFWTGLTILIMIFMLLILIYNIIKKHFLMSMMILMIFIKSIIVFLTTPAAYFMYYFTDYVVGIFIIIIFILELLKLEGRNKSNIYNH